MESSPVSHYTITKGSVRGIVSSKGGELISLSVGGREMLWHGDEKYWAGRNPTLFPVIGCLKGGKTSIGGREYAITKHGFARDLTFEVTDVQPDQVTMLLKDDPYTRAMYPYSFNLVITHRILENGFSTTLSVENTDDRDIFFGIGGHTGFVCPMSGDAFSDYDIVFNKQETKHISPLSLDHALFKHDVIMFDNMRSDSVKLINRHTGRGIRFDFEGFNVFAVWQPYGQDTPFVCLEPWSMPPDSEDSDVALENKPYITALKPNETQSFAYSAVNI